MTITMPRRNVRRNDCSGNSLLPNRGDTGSFREILEWRRFTPFRDGSHLG